MSESVRVIPPFVESVPEPRSSARPTTREWTKHGILFALTVLTTTFAGVLLVSDAVPEPTLREPSTILGYLAYVPGYYLQLIGNYIQHSIAQPVDLAKGLMFSGSLLAILTAHEFGHYIACRRYGVNATLPYFIPAPPLFLAGTFGAFIRIKSPIPSRRSLFDIGVAGPIAGFIVCVPIAIAGVLTLRPAPPIEGSVILFEDPLLFRLIARVFSVELQASSAPNPFYFASWIGLLVTSLNLMPVGQLDGGHATYSLFGSRSHKWIGRCAFVMTSVLAVLGMLWYGSPSGFLYAALLAVLLRIKHPNVGNESQLLDRTRIIVAIITVIIFAVSFLPFPIKVL